MKCEKKEYPVLSLGNFSNMKYGKMPKKDMVKENGKYPVFSGYRIVGYCDECNLDKQQLIVVARGVGGTGDVKLSPGACFLTNLSIAVIIDENIALKQYLFYYFQKHNLRYLDSGSAQSQITIADLKNIVLPIPPLEIQSKIVEILSSFDDKIELNNKINENLEQQARALLSHWLIENDGTYEFTTLSEVAVINPDTYSPKDAWEYVDYLDTSSITDGLISEVQHIKPSTEKLPSRARRIIAANDVVFSTVRPNQRHFGIISKPLDHMLASTGFAVIRSNHPSVSNELLYLCLTKEDFIEKMQQLAEQSTSTFPSIKPTDLGGCKIPCPISEELTMNLKAVFDCIASNHIENQTLARIRDTILPKLMNGEIEIDEI